MDIEDRKDPTRNYFIVEGMMLSEAILRAGPNYKDNSSQFKFDCDEFDVKITGFTMHFKRASDDEIEAYEASIAWAGQ